MGRRCFPRILLGTSAAMLALLLQITGCKSPTADTSNAPTGQQNSSLNAKVILPVNTVAQQTPEWCWLASGQMIFQYFGIPAVNPLSYQCGIIGVVAGPNSACFVNCSLCPVGAGSFPAGTFQTTSFMLQTYSFYATNGTRQLTFQFTPSSLLFAQVQASIDAKSPVLAGINTGGAVVFGNSQHLVVIVGYEIQSGQLYLVVNDPFPYALAGVPDPYAGIGAVLVQPGQYLVGFNLFSQGFAWNAAWYGMALM